MTPTDWRRCIIRQAIKDGLSVAALAVSDDCGQVTLHALERAKDNLIKANPDRVIPMVEYTIRILDTVIHDRRNSQ